MSKASKKLTMKRAVWVVIFLVLQGCSVVGKSSVEIAPYRVLKSAPDRQIELRQYEQLILVTAPLGQNIYESRNSAFGMLFDYISGANIQQSKIEMTAPVLMQNNPQSTGEKIPMTAPVFMQQNEGTATMSFVLPHGFQLETAPRPSNENLQLSKLMDYTVAAITFRGMLKQNNIEKHEKKLREWIQSENYSVTGDAQVAGYNPPFTIPALRRNEVLIPIKKHQFEAHCIQ